MKKISNTPRNILPAKINCKNCTYKGVKVLSAGFEKKAETPDKVFAYVEIDVEDDRLASELIAILEQKYMFTINTAREIR